MGIVSFGSRNSWVRLLLLPKVASAVSYFFWLLSRKALPSVLKQLLQSADLEQYSYDNVSIVREMFAVQHNALQAPTIYQVFKGLESTPRQLPRFRTIAAQVPDRQWYATSAEGNTKCTI